MRVPAGWGPRAVLLLAALTAAALAVACVPGHGRTPRSGSEGRGDSVAGAAAKPAPPLDRVDPAAQSLSFWYPYTGAALKEMKELIAEFNRKNRWGITVRGEYGGPYADLYDKMIPAIAGNATPNLVVAYQNQAATYEQAGALVDLNPYVDAPRWGIESELADFFHAFLRQDVTAEFGGKRLGFPLGRSLDVLYYNADWLARLGYSAPPAAWPEFAQACERAARSTPGAVGYEASTDASNIFAQVISRGGGIVGPRGLGYDLDTPQMRASMRFMRALYREGAVGRIAERYGDETDFANRKVLFTMSSTADIPFYAQAIEASGRPFRWGVAAIPHSTPRATLDVYGASVSVTRSTPAAELASWLFIRWMAEPAQQAAWTRASNYFPVRISSADALGGYFAAHPQFAEAFRLLSSADLATEPPFSGYDLVRDAMSAAYNSILDGAAIDDTLAALADRANRIYRESTGE